MADRRRQGAEDAGQHPLTAFLEIARRGRSCAKLLQLPELRAGQHGHKIVGTTEPQRDEILQRTSEKLLRSEEHTSELQSLMRISYAVFCLKKKTNKRHKQKITNKTTSQTITKNNPLQTQ